MIFAGSWRHTPFRNTHSDLRMTEKRSWRHTPFRKSCTIQ
ncbi:hypothetical protein URS_2206 [Acinetobacter ursingii]|nr:hypothetical protein URS_2206 [Acinetobacter ursingii]